MVYITYNKLNRGNRINISHSSKGREKFCSPNSRPYVQGRFRRRGCNRENCAGPQAKEALHKKDNYFNSSIENSSRQWRSQRR